MEPFWLSVARAFIGLQEKVGAGSNPVILRWAKDLNAPSWYDDDDKAWCALFWNRINVACQLPTSGKGYDLLRAMSSLTWGVTLNVPALGATMVFNRPGGAHVGFYLGERHDGAYYYVLGGNTGNSVNAAWIAKDRLSGIRWPAGQNLFPATPLIILADNGQPISHNEA